MRKTSGALALLALTSMSALQTASAAPFVETYALALLSTQAGPTTFNLSFPTPFVATGPVGVQLSIAGAYADGARDGASVTPVGAEIASVDFGGGAVVSAGGAASFVGTGGTAGEIMTSAFGATNNQSNPLPFTFTFGQPIGPTDLRSVSHGAVGGAVADGAVDGAGVTGSHPGGGVVKFSVKSGSSTVASHERATLGPYTDAAPFSDAGAADVPCSAGVPCDVLESQFFFELSEGDAAAMVARHEFGGDPIDGTVLSTYALDIDFGTFDCASIGGCTQFTANVDFILDGFRDTFAFVARVEINSLAVPEPSTLSLVGGALAALGFSRRRKRAPA